MNINAAPGAEQPPQINPEQMPSPGDIMMYGGKPYKILERIERGGQASYRVQDENGSTLIVPEKEVLKYIAEQSARKLDVLGSAEEGTMQLYVNLKLSAISRAKSVQGEIDKIDKGGKSLLTRKELERQRDANIAEAELAQSKIDELSSRQAGTAKAREAFGTI